MWGALARHILCVLSVWVCSIDIMPQPAHLLQARLSADLHTQLKAIVTKHGGDPVPGPLHMMLVRGPGAYGAYGASVGVGPADATDTTDTPDTPAAFFAIAAAGPFAVAFDHVKTTDEDLDLVQEATGFTPGADTSSEDTEEFNETTNKDNPCVVLVCFRALEPLLETLQAVLGTGSDTATDSDLDSDTDSDADSDSDCPSSWQPCMVVGTCSSGDTADRIVESLYTALEKTCSAPIPVSLWVCVEGDRSPGYELK